MNEINMSNYNTSSPSISSSSSSKKCVPSVDARRSSSSSTCIFPKPPWLISTLHDLEGKMKSLSLIRNIGKDKDHGKNEINNVLDDDDDDDDDNDDDEEEAEDTFAERAEIYYLKRPQLLNLLHDLYNNYLSLSDRYCQTLTKLQNHPITNYCDSNAQSSLSHQSSSSSISSASNLDMDTIVASLVMKMVENDIILQELNTSEKKWGESIRKTELQGSLLEVLESERLVLLSENSRLCVRANETLLMKRTTTTTNDQVDVDKDHRLYMLNRRIEDLQEQIRCLQGQLTSGDRLMVMINHHQYHQSPYYANKGLGWKLENEKMSNIVGCFNDYEGIASTSCSSSSNMGMINGEKKKKTRKMMIMKKKRELKVASWWNRFKNFELLLCGIHDDSTSR